MLLSILKYLLPFLIGGIVVYVLIQKRNAELEDTLQKNDKKHEQNIERFKETIDSLLMRDKAWALEYQLVKDTLKVQRLKTNQVLREYLKLKNAPAVHYSDAALDSVVFAITDRYAQGR